MNTAGKAVDSVIQYQLHRDCNGGGGESGARVINEVYLGEITATQEDVDNYGFWGPENTPLEIGTKYKVYELPVSYNDIVNKVAFVVYTTEGGSLNSGNDIIIGYKDNSYNGLYMALTNSTEWSCIKNNLNLRKYFPGGIS